MKQDSDEHLVRYLLGDLPDVEAERLDEQSIADDEFALRLRVLEDDLIDRYAHGERFDVSLRRFDRQYRASRHLREKVRFARALSALTATARPAPAIPRTPAGRGAFRQWSLAAAAILLLAATGYLGMRSMRLREEIGQLDARRAAAERQRLELQQELDRTRATPGPQRSPVTATFLLPPPRRGLGGDTVVSVSRRTEQVALRLVVESEHYARFWAALGDPATSSVVWRTGDLQADANGRDAVVLFTLPASLLKAQRYSIELSGITRTATQELVGYYPIRVVLE